ncbi:hypothetical protein CONLIGDRAFT_685880 [Coniochaeta ligniaria NRRL 30616]|uniref:Uncharacterized protein n=1 Tax=Coniochaeta ligniaria NRRL 30616 TaxID=1408157 RepID=A0A1J7I9Y2_9PEZI|nr:hypothetical protein CONLIGDRAFT_685880 [Coniochaeta ligniaria NRRL 30616]
MRRLGQFNPDFLDPQDLGVISDENMLGFTDVMAFQEAVLIWWKSDVTALDADDCEMKHCQSSLILLPAIQARRCYCYQQVPTSQPPLQGPRRLRRQPRPQSIEHFWSEQAAQDGPPDPEELVSSEF